MYPNKDDTVDILLDAARKAAFDTNVNHPEDIATAMSFAIESVSKSLLLAYEKFGVKHEEVLSTIGLPNYRIRDFNSDS